MSEPTVTPAMTAIIRDDFPNAEQRKFIDCLGRYASRLVCMLRALGFLPEVIEEAVPEAICSALVWIRNGRVAAIRHRRAYLRRTAYGIAVAITERTQDAVSLGDVAEPAAPEQLELDPVRTALAKESVAALAALTQRQRVAIELCILRSLSLREAAGMMGCRASTVAARIKAGLSALRRNLKDLVPPTLLRDPSIRPAPVEPLARGSL